jgi:hypothetical protein
MIATVQSETYQQSDIRPATRIILVLEFTHVVYIRPNILGSVVIIGSLSLAPNKELRIILVLEFTHVVYIRPNILGSVVIIGSLSLAPNKEVPNKNPQQAQPMNNVAVI